MSRYDCRDCGAHLGLCYGQCNECTPQEVLDAGKKLSDEICEYDKAFDDNIKKLRQHYIDEKVAHARERYMRLYKKYKPNDA